MSDVFAGRVGMANISSLLDKLSPLRRPLTLVHRGTSLTYVYGFIFPGVDIDLSCFEVPFPDVFESSVYNYYVYTHHLSKSIYLFQHSCKL